MSRTWLILVFGLLIVAILASTRFTVRETLQRGNEALMRGDLNGAEHAYRQALQRRPESGPGLFNLGVANYHQRLYAEAAQNFERASSRFGRVRERVRSHFNRGDALFQLGSLENASEAFKEALRLDPSDEDARYNLAFVDRMIRERAKKATQGARPPMTQREAEDLIASLGQPTLRITGQPQAKNAPRGQSHPPGLDK
jgi:Tfp pilus assembly protein PilF